MIVLAEPVPEDMISSIGKAIKLLPKIDTYAIHAWMKDFYGWSDVVLRTVVVCDRALKDFRQQAAVNQQAVIKLDICSLINLLPRIHMNSL